MTIQTENFMNRAIELARKGVGRTAPNPPVGAVVVQNGEILGEGFHPAAGQPHAEVFALREAGDLSLGAELYVTLEPCCHQGRTGPCTEAIINAGISKVYVGTKDPNPQVAGQGMAFLQASGVEVVCGLLEEDCKSLIAPFAKQMLQGLPYVVFKSAVTLDGQTSTSAGDSKWISCEASRDLVHQLRNQVDAIMVGSGTVIADDPRLTTRITEGGRDPVRIVLDGGLNTSPEANVYVQSSEAKTILVTSLQHSEEDLDPFRKADVEIILVENGASGLDLHAVLSELGQRNLQHILLEGGRTLGGAMMREGLVDRIMLFVAPKIVGGSGCGLFSGEGVLKMADSMPLVNLRARQVDSDILLEGEVQHVHRSD